MAENVLDTAQSPAPVDRSRVAIVSGGDEIRLRSYVNHAIYARSHGFDHRLECGVDPGITHRFDYKTAIIRRLLPRYDWLAWIDDDAFFTDFESDHLAELIARAEDADAFLVIAEGPLEPNGFWSRINSGVMILRSDSRTDRMLSLMSSVDLDTVRAWWSDEEHGLFTGGDQDEMWWALSSSGLLDGAMIVGHRELNSRSHYYDASLSDAFVMHFCGHRDKPLGIARFADRFGIGHELVPEEYLDRYCVRVRSPMTRGERALRAARQEAIARVKPYLRPAVQRYRRLRSG